MIRFTPKQGAAAAEIIRDLAEAGQPVEVRKLADTRTVTISGTKDSYTVGGRGKVEKV